jgi:hypothetical protein
MRKTIVAAALAAMAAATALSVASPASAATSGTTTTTVTISGGALAITVPAAADLGTVGAGANATGSLGVVQVTDARGLLTASWTASVISTSFKTGGGTTPETIPATAVSYWSGPATATTGTGVFTPGQLTAALAVPIDTSKTAFTLTLGVGSNSASWNPGLIIAVPAAAVAGKYTGTVTHSVL